MNTIEAAQKIQGVIDSVQSKMSEHMSYVEHECVKAEAAKGSPLTEEEFQTVWVRACFWPPKPINR